MPITAESVNTVGLCRHCFDYIDHHAKLKCLFQATTYESIPWQMLHEAVERHMEGLRKEVYAKAQVHQLFLAWADYQHRMFKVSMMLDDGTILFSNELGKSDFPECQ